MTTAVAEGLLCLTLSKYMALLPAGNLVLWAVLLWAAFADSTKSEPITLGSEIQLLLCDCCL